MLVDNFQPFFTFYQNISFFILPDNLLFLLDRIFLNKFWLFKAQILLSFSLRLRKFYYSFWFNRFFENRSNIFPFCYINVLCFNFHWSNRFSSALLHFRNRLGNLPFCNSGERHINWWINKIKNLIWVSVTYFLLCWMYIYVNILRRNFKI